MATPPKVQSLSDIMAGLEPAYRDSRRVQQKRRQSIPGRYDAQRQGLEVEKQNEFRDINRSANSKGLAFSGIPIEEQTRYLGEEYLPTLGAYDQQENQELMAIEEALAGLSKEQRLKATDMRSTQQERRQSFLEAQRQRQLRLRLQRMQQQAARELEQMRIASQQRLARINNAAKNQPDPEPTVQERKQADKNELGKWLAANDLIGGDGHVHPETWAKMRAQWSNAGWDVSEFNREFGHLVNTRHAADYGIGPQFSY